MKSMNENLTIWLILVFRLWATVFIAIDIVYRTRNFCEDILGAEMQLRSATQIAQTCLNWLGKGSSPHPSLGGSASGSQHTPSLTRYIVPSLEISLSIVTFTAAKVLESSSGAASRAMARDIASDIVCS
jgi:hypothetical protein